MRDFSAGNLGRSVDRGNAGRSNSPTGSRGPQGNPSVGRDNSPGSRNFASRNFSSRSNNGQRFEANRPNFGNTGLGPSSVRTPNGPLATTRNGVDRANFISRNFSNSDFRNGGRPGSPDGNFGRGPGGDFGRGNGGDFGRGNGGDFGRGNDGRGDWNRNNWNGNRGDWSKNDWNRGGGNWGKGDWGRNDWNRQGWNGGRGWNNNWNNNWNNGWSNNWNNGWSNRWNNNWWGGNRGWWGYNRNVWWTPGWNSWGWGWGWHIIGWNNWGWNNWGWGLGNVGWGGYSYPTYYDTTYVYPTTTLYADATDVVVPNAQPAVVDPLAAAGDLALSGDFVADGEAAFRAGRYQDALRLWQHSMVDDPDNGAVVLLMAQAMFALGQYDAAANTTQMAMQMLPEAEWGNVVKNYTQLYGNIEDYTTQVRAAEKARDAHADDGAVRFVLGYHFGYLNYPKQAVRELDAALAIEPRDVGAEKLRDMFAVQAGIPARPHTAQAPDGQPAAGQPTGAPIPGQAPMQGGPTLGPDQPALPKPVPPSVGTDA